MSLLCKESSRIFYSIKKKCEGIKAVNWMLSIILGVKNDNSSSTNPRCQTSSTPQLLFYLNHSLSFQIPHKYLPLSTTRSITLSSKNISLFHFLSSPSHSPVQSAFSLSLLASSSWQYHTLLIGPSPNDHLHHVCLFTNLISKRSMLDLNLFSIPSLSRITTNNMIWFAVRHHMKIFWVNVKIIFTSAIHDMIL